MQFSKTIHFDFLNAIKKLENTDSATSYQKAVDDFFYKYPLQECQQIIMDFLAKLYRGNLDNFFSADARLKLVDFYEKANNLLMSLYMEHINQRSNSNKSQLEEGGNRV